MLFFLLVSASLAIGFGLGFLVFRNNQTMINKAEAEARKDVDTIKKAIDEISG